MKKWMNIEGRGKGGGGGGRKTKKHKDLKMGGDTEASLGRTARKGERKTRSRNLRASVSIVKLLQGPCLQCPQDHRGRSSLSPGK